MSKISRPTWSMFRIYTLCCVIVAAYSIFVIDAAEIMVTSQIVPFFSIVAALLFSAFYFVTHIERSEKTLGEIALKRKYNEAGIKETAFTVWFYVGGFTALMCSIASGPIIYDALLPNERGARLAFELNNEGITRFALFIFMSVSFVLFLYVANGPRPEIPDRDAD